MVHEIKDCAMSIEPRCPQHSVVAINIHYVEVVGFLNPMQGYIDVCTVVHTRVGPLGPHL